MIFRTLDTWDIALKVLMVELERICIRYNPSGYNLPMSWLPIIDTTRGKPGSMFNAYSAPCQAYNDRSQGYLTLTSQGGRTAFNVSCHWG